MGEEPITDDFEQTSNKSPTRELNMGIVTYVSMEHETPNIGTGVAYGILERPCNGNSGDKSRYELSDEALMPDQSPLIGWVWFTGVHQSQAQTEKLASIC